MNWKLIFLLSLSSIAVSLLSVFVPTQRIEWIFWLVIFSFNAYVLAKRNTGKFFLHGWLISIVNGVWIAIVHASFIDTYTANNPGTEAMYQTMPHFAPMPVMVLILGPVFGAIFGVISGLFAFVGSKIWKPA